MTSATPIARQAYNIYAVLCAGFLASQFYRVSNAVIAPELMRELSITPEAMGFVTGIFFLVFAAAQLPVGVLLDRYGLRRTMSGLFLIAVLGSIVFALAEDVFWLAVGRGLMGLGCAAGLMGSLVAISRWFEPARFAPLSSLLYTLGGAGLLLATTPLAWIAAEFGWRSAFWMMASLTALLAMLLYAIVRNRPSSSTESADEAHETLGQVLLGMRTVFGNRQLWLICAIQFVNYGTVLSVAGLWAGPYLNDVHSLDGVTRGNVLLALNIAMLVGVMTFSAVERWLNSRKWTIFGGGCVSAITLLILALYPQLNLWTATSLLILFALSSAYIMLIHAHARAVLPDHIVGRGLTLQNLAVFLGVFVLQWATGFIVGGFDAPDGIAPVDAYQTLFAFLAGVTVVALCIYVWIQDVSVRGEAVPKTAKG